MICFFSDKKNFDKHHKFNTKNDRCLCAYPSEVLTIIYTKFPATVMILRVVSNEGHMMPLHFFPEDLRINSPAYIEVLETVVKPWIDSMRNERPYVF